MRLLIQHVKEARVEVEGAVVGKIGKGLLVFLGIHKDDVLEDCLLLKQKLIHLRIFTDSNGKMNLSILDVGGEILVVSQFTLYADCTKSRRPSFDQSARSENAKPLYNRFVEELKQTIKIVETGRFSAHMDVHLINEGPLTFLLDSNNTNCNK